MALNGFAVRALKVGLADAAAGQEVATLIDTHGAGTLSGRTEHAVKTMFGSSAQAAAFITAVEASSALSAANVAKLGVALKNRKAAALIAAELIA